MLAALRFLLWSFARGVLWLRYRIRLHGLEQARVQAGPFLILPNHPGYIDPPIVLTTLFPDFRPRPLLFEGNFTNPLLYPVMVLMDALRVPDLDQTSAEARARTAEAIAGVKDALRAGRNVILWPSGRLQRAGLERLGAARTVADVLRDVPEVRLLLVRTRGVWGSRFSFGFDGTRPPFFHRLLQGAGWILANLIFFAPRRRVDLTLEVVERSRLPGLNREQVNPWLEAWYNEGGGAEAPTFVPIHFWFGPRSHTFPVYQTAEDVDLGTLRDETRQAVEEMLGEKLGRTFAAGELTPETTLDSLGMDSLDRMELSLSVERRFGFHGDQVPATLGQLYALAAGLARREPPRPPDPAWFRPASSDRAALLADTVAAAFVERALACPRDVAAADDRSGVQSYERLLVGALTLARRFRELPGSNVGLLLPSSVACDLALLGLYLADKVPVVLNWTTGPANLAHAARLMELRHVITSKVFLDRLGVEVAGTSPVYLETLTRDVGRFEQLWTLLCVRCCPGRVRGQTPRPEVDRPAVVLFTSGSEKAPKAVPLTHRNLLTNQRDGLGVFGVTRRDSLLGFLPAFHSFGLSITGLFPLLAGMRVVRHPDPTDAAALARKVGTYRPTILVGTPTFLSYLVERAEPGELASLRLVVSGAEKCPADLVERFTRAAPGAVVLEGYGITECSPVVAVNPPDGNRPGSVGRPLPSVETCVLDLETDRPLPAGGRGMLLVAGPTIFPGYLGTENPSPFRELNGKRWYVTGDLVEIDADGYIRFAGRLKRFVKAGGEMISLPALEEPLATAYPPGKEGPRVAVEGIETDGGGRRIVLFTTEAVTLREANDLLLRQGFHGVMRLDEVRRLERLPVLGTGKTDYKVLRAQIVAVPAAPPVPTGAESS